jgi:hypothetical protein
MNEGWLDDNHPIKFNYVQIISLLFALPVLISCSPNSQKCCKRTHPE